MNSSTTFEIESNSPDDTSHIGERIGSRIRGGEVIELTGDVGSGKTVFVQGVARGIKSKDAVMSPTFTISRIYNGKSIDVHHFDFYRLDDPGVMSAELTESIGMPHTSVVIEWSDVVDHVLPEDRLRIAFAAFGTSERRLTFYAGDAVHTRLTEEIR